MGVVSDAKVMSYGAGLTKRYFEEQTQKKFDPEKIQPRNTNSITGP